MDEKTRVLICLGAAVSANCVACFRHFHREAVRLGVEPAEVDEAIALAGKVKTGANIAVMSAVAETTARASGAASGPGAAIPDCCARPG